MTAMSMRSAALYRRLAADVGTLGLATGPAQPRPVTEAQLDGLPDAAQRYLRFMGAVGRPADWSFLAHVTGKFRLRPGLPWMRCQAWQYNSGPSVARLFHMRIDAAGVLPMTGRDAYVGGHGRLLAKLAGRVTVADTAGPETDLSELVTYLNDAVLFAPSMLLVPAVRWAAVDDRSFEITLDDSGHRVTARVFLDERGAPVNFSTEDRWADLPGGLARMRWSTPVRGWTEVNGRWQASRGAAIWHMPEGPFCYAIFQFPPGAVSYNVPPAELGAPEQAGAVAGLARAAHRVKNWGATEDEQNAELPGDELVPGEAAVTTRAVSVDAPAGEVWRWLVQIGQDRGGLYSYDWLENIAGLHVHSTEEIREEWQHLAPGDQVRLVPKGWLGLPGGLALPVAQVDPGRAIVLREQPPQQPWDAIWSFHVRPLGPGRCRLVSRSRSAPLRGGARLAAPIMEPVTLVMTRKMLLGIKQRAEAAGEGTGGEIVAGRPPGGADATRGQGPLPRSVAWPAVLRCAGSTARLLARRRIHLPRGHAGMRLRFADGTSARVYRETVVDTAPAQRPCILVVGFRLRAVRGSLGHALFRRESLLNTPLFAGFPGLISKLWIAHDEHGVYRGLYEWDGPDQAEHYARCLWRVLELVCVPGTIHYQVLPGRSRGELPGQQHGPTGTGPADAAAWWQVTGRA